jgi:hypothetical protein
MNGPLALGGAARCSSGAVASGLRCGRRRLGTVRGPCGQGMVETAAGCLVLTSSEGRSLPAHSSTVSGAALYTKGRCGGKCIFGNACRPSEEPSHRGYSSKLSEGLNACCACRHLLSEKLPNVHVWRPNLHFSICRLVASNGKCLLPHALPNEVTLLGVRTSRADGSRFLPIGVGVPSTVLGPGRPSADTP